jgi:hypothetical protein
MLLAIFEYMEFFDFEGKKVVTVILLIVTAFSTGLFVNTEMLKELFTTLIIAQVSLLAILVSISFLSVQISSQVYTPLLAERFKEDGFLTEEIISLGSVVLLYLFLFLLTPLIQNTIFVPILAVLAVMGIIFTIYLILDIKNDVLGLINPDSLLRQISNESSFEEYKNYSDREINGEKDRNPLLVIYQLGIRSIDENNEYTAIKAVEALEDSIEDILEGYYSKKESDLYFEPLFNYWNGLMEKSIEKDFRDLTRRIVKAESSLVEKTWELDFKDLNEEFISNMQKLCQTAFEEGKLEHGYYRPIEKLLEDGIERKDQDLARQGASNVYFFGAKIQSALKPGSKLDCKPFWRQVMNLRDGAIGAIELSEFEEKEIEDTFYKEIENALICLLRAAIKDGVSEQEFSELEGNVFKIGESAAMKENEELVKRVARIIIELELKSGEKDTNGPFLIARLMDITREGLINSVFSDLQEEKPKTGLYWSIGSPNDDRSEEIKALQLESHNQLRFLKRSLPN